MTNRAARRRLPEQECLPSTPLISYPGASLGASAGATVARASLSRGAKPRPYSNLLPQFGNSRAAPNASPRVLSEGDVMSS